MSGRKSSGINIVHEFPVNTTHRAAVVAKKTDVDISAFVGQPFLDY